MALTATGIGSGLDITTIVKTLVDSERTPKETRLDSQENKLDAKVSAIGSLKSALTTFQDAVAKLSDPEALNIRKVSQSSEDFFTVTADKDARAGSYNVVVESLASAQKLASVAVSDDSSGVGEGSLSFAIQGKSFSVDVGATDSLEDIANSINNADDNVGVTATIINTDNGKRLVFASDKTGTENAITVTASDTSGTGLSSTFGSGQLETIQAAADSVIKIDGQTLTSSSNKIEGAISGVTFELTDADVGKTTKLTIAQDDDAVKENVQGFVDAYNTLMTKMDSLSSYNVSTNTSAALQGDSIIRSLQSQLRSMVSSRVDDGQGGTTALYDIGISADRQGRLTVDESKLTESLSSGMSKVGTLFAQKDTGIAARMDTVIDGYVKSNGMIASRQNSYTQEKDRIADQREALDRRMELLQARLTKQYNAMDLVVSNLNSQGNSALSALNSLPGVVRKS
ncbi:flagellar filament capping protein FliD [Shewanella sp. C32]|uniref:Flagellar hook-associated protein 2 n=1 Tax=Shewanella electrica TaxID=515560 RepID=A0ABT2FJF3_9GAMM|nr:flagellar filament capping protein FliD [Shewanella electrica]MCH1924563.1 flagellar filament capping protein FliD [Shewanella electrica]MCS4556464.1 flagellar filament capping protein FliD [Shewanella electrica]